MNGSRDRRSAHHTAHTTDGSGHTVQGEASQPNPIRHRNRIHRQPRKTKHKPAPRSDDSRDSRTPDQATIPSRSQNTSSARSDKEPSPKSRTRPRSSPNKVHSPSGHRDMEPNPGRSQPDATPDRSLEPQ